MASVGGNQKTGPRGRKNLDCEINLVPFIDLLSMCICFLLMTAVWIQIGAVQVKQARGTDAAATPANTYEIELKFQSATVATLEMKKGAKVAKSIKINAKEEAGLLAQLDSGVKTLVAHAGGNAQTSISAAMLTPKVGVTYGTLVNVMDVLRKNQIVNLGVHPAPGGITQ